MIENNLKANKDLKYINMLKSNKYFKNKYIKYINIWKQSLLSKNYKYFEMVSKNNKHFKS